MNRSVVIGLHAAAAFGVVLPIAIAEVPPLVDFPKVAALLAVLGQTDPALADSYTVAGGFAPYLGYELLAMPLLAFMGPLVAARIVLAGALLLTGLAPAVIHRVLYGELSAWPLLGWLAAYHHAVFWGFLNFTIAVPVIVLGVGVWLAIERPAIRAAATTGFAAMLMCIHLVSWGAYGLFLLGGLVPAVRERRWAEIGWAAVPFASTFAVWRLLPKRAGPDLLHPDELYVYGTIPERIRDLTSPFNFDYLATDIGMVVFGGGLLYWMFREGVVDVHERARWPLIFAGVGIFAMPHILLGGWGTLRLPVLATLVVLGTTQPTRAGATALQRIGVVAGLLLGLRTGQLTVEFARCQPVFAELRAGYAQVDPGDVVIPVLGDGSHPQCLKRPVFSHPTAFATLDRGAFSYQIIGYPGVFAVDDRPELDELPSPLIPAVLDQQALSVIEEHGDFVIDVHFGAPVPALERYPVVTDGGWYTLRRVE